MKVIFEVSDSMDAVQPAHAFYTPDYVFAETHKLIVEEAETWVAFYKTSGRDSDSISFNKETGELTVEVFEEWADEGGTIFKHLFCGYLPDQAAFEAVLAYTRWLDHY